MCRWTGSSRSSPTRWDRMGHLPAAPGHHLHPRRRGERAAVPEFGADACAIPRAADPGRPGQSTVRYRRGLRPTAAPSPPTSARHARACRATSPSSPITAFASGGGKSSSTTTTACSELFTRASDPNPQLPTGACRCEAAHSHRRFSWSSLRMVGEVRPRRPAFRPSRPEPKCARPCQQALARPGCGR